MVGRILLVTVALFCVVSGNMDYTGYQVLRVQPKDESQIHALVELRKFEKVDFWSEINTHGKPVDVLIPPHLEQDMKIYLSSHGLDFTILIKNVQKLVNDDFVAQNQQRAPTVGNISFTKYNKLIEINNYIRQIAKDHPDIVSLVEIGKTYEGRELYVMKLSKNPAASKPIIFIDAGIHAREWITQAQSTYIIHQLVEKAENSKLLDEVDWHILPVLNPDGYEYTHTTARFWRKNRSKGRKCDGTDLNRNFDFHWGEGGASANECSETYKGPNASSELETQALIKYLSSTKNIKLYLTLHTEGCYLLYPWGYTKELPEDVKELQSLGETVAESMYKILGNNYTVGSSSNVLYINSGPSDDWAKGVAGVELSYTIELTKGYGFHPPPSQILPFVREGWEGIKAFHHYIEHKFGK